MTQEQGQIIIKADRMRELATKGPTAHALLLYLALYPDNTEAIKVSFLKSELSEHGVEVNETELYDTLQELEDLGLGSIVYAQAGQGEDVFKHGYNLSLYAKRSFPVEYLVDWEQRVGQEDGQKLKLVDPKFRFKETQEEKKERLKASGKRGRPAGYSLKLGRYFTPEELAEREAKKKNKRPRGRPVGWRKYAGQDGAAHVRAASMRKTNGTGKRGRPAGYSPKLGRYLTAAELAAKGNGAPKKRGRPKGWRKDKSSVTTPSRASNAPVMRTSKGADRILNIPLQNGRNIRIELPKKLNASEKKLLKVNLEAIL